jgi:hypothetical protein
MKDDMPEITENHLHGADHWDDAEMKKKLEGAISKTDTDGSDSDPFATDGLGHEPAEEDDSGSL